MNNDFIEIEGVVETNLPGSKFIVMLDNGTQVRATISGRLRQGSIRILEGDRVKVKISTYDLTNGIISYRYR